MIRSDTVEISAPLPEFDAYAEGYDAALNQGLRFTGERKDYFAEGRVRWLAGCLVRLGWSVQSCLDFGCGTGTGCEPLVGQFGLQCYLGYDPSDASIEQARCACKTAGVAFECRKEAVSELAFDLAFTNGVFHHIPTDNRAEAAELVFRALKPGAFFAFWENNRWNPMVHFIMSRVPFDAEAQMLFPFQARRLLRDAGFEILRTDYQFVFPAALKSLRPLEPFLCKVPLGGQYLVLARRPL